MVFKYSSSSSSRRQTKKMRCYYLIAHVRWMDGDKRNFDCDCVARQFPKQNGNWKFFKWFILKRINSNRNHLYLVRFLLFFCKIVTGTQTINLSIELRPMHTF